MSSFIRLNKRPFLSAHKVTWTTSPGRSGAEMVNLVDLVCQKFRKSLIWLCWHIIPLKQKREIILPAPFPSRPSLNNGTWQQGWAWALTSALAPLKKATLCCSPRHVRLSHGPALPRICHVTSASTVFLSTGSCDLPEAVLGPTRPLFLKQLWKMLFHGLWTVQKHSLFSHRCCFFLSLWMPCESSIILQEL